MTKKEQLTALVDEVKALREEVALLRREVAYRQPYWQPYWQTPPVPQKPWPYTVNGAR